MKVYDIIQNLNEEIDIRQLPNGDGFEVFDTETDRRVRGTIIYPTDGAAEEARDRIRARTPATQQPQNDGSRNNQNDPDGNNSNNRRTIPDDGNLPEREKKSLYKKAKDFFKFSGKAAFGKLGGTLVAVILNAMNVKDDFDMLIDQYVQSGCNRDRYVRHAEQTIRISLVEAVRDILSGALGGALTAAAALAIIPGLGWLASFGVGVVGGIAGMALAKMATNDTVVNNIATWIGDNLFLKDLTGLVDVMDDVLEEMGYDIVSCRESAELNPGKFLILEVKDDVVYESVSNSEMRKMGLAMKQAIVQDPEIRKEYKKLKRQESD